VLLAGCSDLSGTGGKGYITSDGTVTEIAPGDRGDRIELTGEDLSGEPLALAPLRGKPVVVNVWWSACPPCIVEQPHLNEVADDLGDRASFVGVNIRDASAENAQAYVRGQDVAYPSFYSPDGRALLPFSGELGPRDIPSTLVLDRDGRIAAVVRGAIPSKQTLVSVVEKVLDE